MENVLRGKNSNQKFENKNKKTQKQNKKNQKTNTKNKIKQNKKQLNKFLTPKIMITLNKQTK